jgi:hypothetical protein
MRDLREQYVTSYTQIYKRRQRLHENLADGKAVVWDFS